MRITDVSGPFDLMDRLAIHPCSFQNRVLSRRSSDYLTEASICNFTYYPPIQGEEPEDAEVTHQAWLDFIDHCRYLVVFSAVSDVFLDAAKAVGRGIQLAKYIRLFEMIDLWL